MYITHWRRQKKNKKMKATFVLSKRKEFCLNKMYINKKCVTQKRRVKK